MNTMYRFHKDGRTYTTEGRNQFEAQLNIEMAWHISLKGATFEEFYKLRVVGTGTVK